MENTLIAKLQEAIAPQGLTLETLAVKAGLDRSYFRKLAERDGASPRGATLEKIAAAAGVTAASLLDGESSRLFPRNEVVPADVTLPPRQSMPMDVPVMGTAAGSLARGAFQFEGGIIDYVRRPPGLIGAKDIYSLFVEGSSMEPQYFPGDLIYVNPHRPARQGDIIVVQCRNGDHSPEESTLGIYIKKTEKMMIVGKRNPVGMNVEIKMDYVKAIHRVFSTNELFGV